MSGYGKPSQQPEYDTRSSQSQHYSALQQAPYTNYGSSLHYANPPITSQSPPAARTITHGHAQQTLSEPLFSPRSYPAQPDIAGSSPNDGPSGTQYTVYLRSATDLTTDPRSFRLMFGSRRTSPELSRSSTRDIYNLSVQVPEWSSTGWVSSAPNVYLVIEDEQGEELGTVEAGIFTYTDAPPQPSFSPTRTNMRNRKRKSSTEIDNRAKRPATASQPIRPKSEDFGSHGYQAYGNPNSYPSYPSNQGDKGYGLYSGYDNPENQPSVYPGQTSPRHSAFSYPYPAPADPSRNPQSWGQPIQSGNASRALPSPDQPGAALPSPSEPSTPALIRTSTIQVSPTLPPPPANAASLPGFNPYSIYPHKAILRFQGELGDMAKSWSSDEWDSRRRLVQFWRNQKGNTIHTTFRPVEPNDRDLHGICISCIWWAEKSECFVTSVDCIHLLESLIAVRFTVEEKNRIRRNLEGCRPQTVSKAKPETEAFFKLIMAFPAPKPRNIEKDVKVYPWAVLQDALRKIIGKYSASYSSTASVIPPNPSSSAYPKHTPSVSEPSRNPQSQSRAGSASSSKAIEPPIIPSSKPQLSVAHAHNASPTTAIGRSTIDALPSILSTSAGAHSGWPPQGIPQHSVSQQPLPPVLRSSWEGYNLDTIPSSAPPPSHSTSYYQRAPDDRDPVSGGAQTSQHASSSANVP